MNNKMSNGVAVMMTILVIAVLELSGYIIYDKIYLKQKNQTENKEKKDVENQEIITTDKYMVIYSNETNEKDENSYLELKSDKTFYFSINLCEGIGNIQGKYNEKNGIITLSNLEKDFDNSFEGASVEKIKLKRENKENLVIEDQIACIAQNSKLQLIK